MTPRFQQSAQGEYFGGQFVVAPQAVREVYKNVSTAIAKFEQTPRFNKCSSKYDFYLAREALLSSSEKRRLALFNGKANCSTCHTSKMQKDVNGNDFPPMFTDYKYYNIGTPSTSGIGAMSEADAGLAGNAQVIADGRASQETGKFKVPSLRNVQNTGLYMHNGSFKYLRDVIHFFNTRDTLVERGNVLSWGFSSWQWPAPETRKNEVTGIIGNLGLSGSDERDIENFLKT